MSLAEVQKRQSPFKESDLRGYSLRRAARMVIPQGIPEHLHASGLEWEIHSELERIGPGTQFPIRATAGTGILIPLNFPAPDPRGVARAMAELGRAYPLDSSTSGEGQEFKFTRPRTFIAALRARLITGRLGARVLSGLPGPMGSPRETAPSQVTWQVEEAISTATMPAFDLPLLTPKSLTINSGLSRQLLTVASEDFEDLFTALFILDHRQAIDIAAFVGAGASGQPAGLFVQAGVQSYDVGPGANANAAPDYADVMEMARLAADANVEEVSFATTPNVATTLKKTLAFSSVSQGPPIWQGSYRDGRCADFPATASNVLSKTLNNGVPGGGAEHGLVAGDFSEMIIALFGEAFELVVDPFSVKKSGVIEFTSFQMADIGLTHPAAFVKGINAIA